jgi:rhomboid family GlyGly-CTERM serine protease
MNSVARRTTAGRSRAARSFPPELWIIASILAIVNLPLLCGSFAGNLIFLPAKVAAGEWWRVLTHPLVHVTWYHLLLDSSGFFFLYAGLDAARSTTRLLYAAGAATGSLLLTLLTSTAVASVGLCGLSGIAHGLMAVQALELGLSREGDAKARRFGLICFSLLVLKVVLEALTGKVFLAILHFGLTGLPISTCHLGGVLGAVTVWGTVDWIKGRSVRMARQG